MTPELENVKGQIGYCGIWCGSCIVGNGALREVTRRYEALVEGYDLESWGAGDFDYAAFARGLAAIQRLEVCRGCREGGGREGCEMRECAKARGAVDCTECDAGAECGHAEMLERMRSGARAVGFSIKSGPADQEKLIEAWMSELGSKWPCCVLFDGHR
ncbi:MAG: DUF3795 domain-containing protein [Phycisphaerales bacterium]|nr:MAG: DUF3795 domain-containing protein [Phycisphaerales bacterium]